MIKYRPGIKEFLENFMIHMLKYIGKSPRIAITLPGDSNFRHEREFIRAFPNIKIIAIEAFSEVYTKIKRDLYKDPFLCNNVNILHTTDADFLNEYNLDKLIDLYYWDFYSNFSLTISENGNSRPTWKKYLPENASITMKSKIIGQTIANTQKDDGLIFTISWSKFRTERNLSFVSSEYTKFIEIHYPTKKGGGHMVFEGFIKRKNFEFDISSINTSTLMENYQVAKEKENGIVRIVAKKQYRNNHFVQFAERVNSLQGSTVRQIAMDLGIDPNYIKIRTNEKVLTH